MRAPVLLVLACSILAGCSLPGSESRDGEDAPDRSAYEGGRGIALVLEGAEGVPFDVRIVLRAGDDVLGYWNETVEANATVEKWWSTKAETVVAQMRYDARRGGGASSSGSGEIEIFLPGCPELTRSGWEFLLVEGRVGSRSLNARCASAEGAA